MLESSPHGAGRGYSQSAARKTFTADDLRTAMAGIEYRDTDASTLDSLIERLRAEGVEVLVDIRLNAISRKAGYSKRALAAAVEAAGIRYVHDPRLGNPKENRAAYVDAASPEGAAARDPAAP